MPVPAWKIGVNQRSPNGETHNTSDLRRQTSDLGRGNVQMAGLRIEVSIHHPSRPQADSKHTAKLERSTEKITGLGDGGWRGSVAGRFGPGVCQGPDPDGASRASFGPFVSGFLGR